MSKSRKDRAATEGFVYGAVSRSEERILDQLHSFREEMNNRFDKVMTHLVDMAGKFSKFDEGQTVLSEHSKNHTDRLEKLEKSVFKSS